MHKKQDNRKLLTDEEIKQAILTVVKKHKRIKSQDDLVSLATKEMRKKAPQALLSGRHARILATEIPQVQVKVHTKTSVKNIPKKCPACEKTLKPLFAVNLARKRVQIGVKCEHCKYYGTLKQFAPFKYEFSWKPSKT